jgi:hypothetical protein
MDLGPRRPGSIGRCRITAGATVTPPVRYARRTRALSGHLAVRSLTRPTATCFCALPNSSTGRPLPTGRERKSRQRRGRPADSRGIKRVSDVGEMRGLAVRAIRVCRLRGGGRVSDLSRTAAASLMLATIALVQMAASAEAQVRPCKCRQPSVGCSFVFLFCSPATAIASARPGRNAGGSVG